MDLEAALKRIKELEDKTADLEEKLYKANAFINELLLKLQNQKEKHGLYTKQQFLFPQDSKHREYAPKGLEHQKQ